MKRSHLLIYMIYLWVYILHNDFTKHKSQYFDTYRFEKQWRQYQPASVILLLLSLCTSAVFLLGLLDDIFNINVYFS